jgi:hypothetical protein
MRFPVGWDGSVCISYAKCQSKGLDDIPPNLAAWLHQVADKVDEAPALPEGWRSE